MAVMADFPALPSPVSQLDHVSKDTDHPVLIYVNDAVLGNGSEQDVDVLSEDSDGGSDRHNQRRKRKKKVKLNLLEGTLLARLNKSSANGVRTQKARKSANLKNGEQTEKHETMYPPLTDTRYRPKGRKEAWAADKDPQTDPKGRLSPAGSIIALPSIDPRCRSPGLFAYLQRTGSAVSNRSRTEPAATPVETALDVVMKLKQKKREDIMAGVPTEFTFGHQGVKVVHDQIHPRRRKKKNQGNTSATSSSLSMSTMSGTSRCESTLAGEDLTDKVADTNKKPPSRAQIPGWYVFPKASDFIPQNKSNKIERAGFGWSVQDPFGKITSSAPHSKPGQGKLCRSFYPVTEALHREGTSVSKVKGTVPGSIDVAKVWNRKLDKNKVNQMVPAQMAKRDIPVVKNPPQKLESPIIHKSKEAVKSVPKSDGK